MSAEAWPAAGRWAAAPVGNFPVVREAEWLRVAARERAVRAASFAWRCRPACWALAPASIWDLLQAVVPRAVAAAIGELPGPLAARSFEPEPLALARQRLHRKGRRKTKCSREQKKDGDSKRLVAPQLKLQFCPQFRLRQFSSPYGNQPRGSIGGAVLAFARARWSDLSSNIVEAEDSLVATERGRGRGLRGLLLCLSKTGLKRRADFRCPVLKKKPLPG